LPEFGSYPNAKKNWRGFMDSHPKIAIECPVLHGFGQMLGWEMRGTFQVSDRASDFENENNCFLVGKPFEWRR